MHTWKVEQHHDACDRKETRPENDGSDYSHPVARREWQVGGIGQPAVCVHCLLRAHKRRDEIARHL